MFNIRGKNFQVSAIFEYRTDCYEKIIYRSGPVVNVKNESFRLRRYKKV